MSKFYFPIPSPQSLIPSSAILYLITPTYLVVDAEYFVLTKKGQATYPSLKLLLLMFKQLLKQPLLIYAFYAEQLHPCRLDLGEEQE